MPSLATRLLVVGCACVLTTPFASSALAKRTQAQLTATFKDRAYTGIDAKPSATPTCSVRFAIVDERRSPEMAGVIGERGVLAPTDPKAWLQAVLGGLVVRGITPVFEDGAGGDGARATFTLQTAWLSSSAVTYSANVVIRVAAASGERKIDRIYRGRVSRTAYWSGGVDTLQSAMDGAFADALDAMASDLKQMC